MESILKEKEAKALKIYTSLDERRRYDALNLFLLEFGDNSPIILPDIAEYILLRQGRSWTDLLALLPPRQTEGRTETRTVPRSRRGTPRRAPGPARHLCRR